MADSRISVAVVPGQPWLERTETGSALHVDFLLHNVSQVPLAFREVIVEVFEGDDLVLRRHLDDNGLPAAVEALCGGPLGPGERRTVFNPLWDFPAGIPATRLHYEFVLVDDSGTPTRCSVEIRPQEVDRPLSLLLPLEGRLLVYEAHGFLDHHRRLDLSDPTVQRIGVTGNSARYSYDLSTVDTHGRCFRGDGSRNDDWYCWEAPVRAAGAGTVVSCMDDQPDHEVGQPGFEAPEPPFDPAVFLGNQVTVDHGDGLFSMTGHLRQGSVRVRPGEQVGQGDVIGQVGFSGSCLTVHTHFQLQCGPSYAAEGVPSVFEDFRRLRGTQSTDVRRGAISTGELLQTLR